MKLFKFKVSYFSGGWKSINVGVYSSAKADAVEKVNSRFDEIDKIEEVDCIPDLFYTTEPKDLSEKYEQLHNERQEHYKALNIIEAQLSTFQSAMYDEMDDEYEVIGSILWKRDDEDGVAKPISAQVKVR